jgi:hypothetical protein
VEAVDVELADGTLYVIQEMDLRVKYRTAHEEGPP